MNKPDPPASAKDSAIRRLVLEASRPDTSSLCTSQVAASFDAPDGSPVSDVLVLLVPAPATDEHLRLLAEASQMLSDQRFRERLAPRYPQEVVRLFAAWPDATPADE